MTQTSNHLILYEFFSCPYCYMTRRALDKLGIEVERRDILKNADYKQQLLTGGGKTQVPCLRIEESGHVSWLYESNDIIRYLQERDR
jgi:glutaredoxin